MLHCSGRQADSRQDYDYYDYEEEASSRDYGHSSYSGGGHGSYSDSHGGYEGYEGGTKNDGFSN